eukprot:COSAG05_NODE_26384_length_188_cov_139.820225_1_plen_47_part_10
MMTEIHVGSCGVLHFVRVCVRACVCTCTWLSREVGSCGVLHFVRVLL